MKYLIILFLFLSCTYKVTNVIDGDTIDVKTEASSLRLNLNLSSFRVRLAGIDCPELAQPYGIQAKLKTSNLCLNKQVKIVKMGRDQYNRILANVFIGDLSVNNELLRSGYAWHYSYYDHSKYRAKIEAEARINKRGLWADRCPVSPWEFRKQLKNWNHGLQKSEKE
jgi:endonuclease YncB( thermonuclease family)